MLPAQWQKAIARAEATGGPLYADMVRLSRRFDDDLGGIGHAVATSLAVLGMAGQQARTPLEVHLLAGRYIDSIVGAQLNSLLEDGAAS